MLGITFACTLGGMVLAGRLPPGVGMVVARRDPLRTQNPKDFSVLRHKKATRAGALVAIERWS